MRLSVSCLTWDQQPTKNKRVNPQKRKTAWANSLGSTYTWNTHIEDNCREKGGTSGRTAPVLWLADGTLVIRDTEDLHSRSKYRAAVNSFCTWGMALLVTHEAGPLGNFGYLSRLIDYYKRCFSCNIWRTLSQFHLSLAVAVGWFSPCGVILDIKYAIRSIHTLDGNIGIWVLVFLGHPFLLS